MCTVIKRELQSYFLNFGPQHPAAHGVLRLGLELSGETVIAVDPHIGFLHRGTEKLLESKTYVQCIPYFDRLDYVSTLPQEHGFVLAVESLLNVNVSTYVQLTRVMLDEISRILNHIMCITTHALDIGAITPFLLGFEEREKLLQVYEEVSGARMHTAFYRIGGIALELPNTVMRNLHSFTTYFLSYLELLDDLLTDNCIWVSRLKGVGTINKKDAVDLGFSGVILRSCGVSWDLRATQPYSAYADFTFNVAAGRSGDAYSRYVIRMIEMRESLKVIQQAIVKINGCSVTSYVDNKLFNKYSTHSFQKANMMEELINSFYWYSKGLKIPSGSTYVVIEAPKGETGVCLVSSGINKPWRCKIKAPGFLHLQGLSHISRNQYLADIVTNIGSLDIVFGEVDR